LTRTGKNYLIISAHNESRNIGSVISRIPSDIDFVVIVDDGSSDETARIAHDFLEKSKFKYVILKHKKNTGQGSARATGAIFALQRCLKNENCILDTSRGALSKPTNFDILIFSDGDGQLDPHDAPKFIDVILNNGADFVKGDRFSTPDLLRIMPKTRLFGNVVLSAITKMASGYWDLTDSQCGYFAIKSKMALKLNWANLRMGYGQINEIVIRLNEVNAKVSSVPIDAVYGVGEVSGIRIRKVSIPILSLCARGFFRRILVKHVVWKSHPLAAFYLFGNILVFAGITLGTKVMFDLSAGFTAPPLTSILVMSLMSLGMLSIFQGVALDLTENRLLHVTNKYNE
jgi:glycosyltransferase involved in cell wall biosynthesis